MMQRFLTDEAVLAKCKIYQMLSAHARGRHLSFHTPGHKVGAWDITELGFSDNLSCPRGCIAEAETDIAQILGAEKSYILTDGSTSGVLSMLHAAKALGVNTLAVCESSHKSVFNGCALLGITPLLYPSFYKEKMPYVPTMYELNENFGSILAQADALFFTSPDYYGNVADLENARAYCKKEGKLLLVDGAHGGHLHFDKKIHASAYADMWVDGVHKSLPALTQGAVVSARGERVVDVLGKAVDIFRTTSPSYPIMASVEYAVKYPENEALKAEVLALQRHPRVYQNDDWTKLCVAFGADAFEVEKTLEADGIYPEFCDGQNIMFYLSPATSWEDFAVLKGTLERLFERFPMRENDNKNIIQHIPAPLILQNKAKKWVNLEQAEGCVCAGLCGLFPPCTPLLQIGENITKAKIDLLKKANNVFGLQKGKILVFDEE